MRLLRQLFCRYPKETLLVLLALLLAGLAEGVSLSALLPTLAAAVDPELQEGLVGEKGSAWLERLGRFGLRPSLGPLILFLVATMLLRGLLLVAAKRQVGYTLAQIATDLRLSLLRSLLAARWIFFLERPLGSFANAMATEADRAAKAYLHATSMVATAFQLLVYVAVAIAVAPLQAALYLSGGMGVAGLLFPLIRMARRAGRKQTKRLKALLSRLTDLLQLVKLLKATGREALADRLVAVETQALNRALRKEVLGKELLKALQPPLFLSLLAAGFYIGVVFLERPVAEVMVLLLLLNRTMGSFGKLQRDYQNMVVCESAFFSLQETVSQAEAAAEQHLGGRPPTLKRGIQLRGVRFSYGDRPILDRVSLEVPSHKLTTLVGPSGAGKTTLIDLIAGLLEPEEGEILIDGVPLRKLDLQAWRSQIGYVPQEIVLFHDTLLFNLTFGDPNLSEEEVVEALKLAHAWEFVERLPEGLQTVVGERGAKLSGGQRQRLALARALLLRPKLLLLDEATSALDPETQGAILSTLEGLKGKLTVLAITHQEPLISISDRVYRLEGGKVYPEPSPTRYRFRTGL